MSSRDERAADWLEDIPRAVWDDAVATIRDAVNGGYSIVLAGHEYPDGDALGSMLALHLFFRRYDGQTVATFSGDPFQVPPQYTFLPGLETLTPPSEVDLTPDLLVALDTASAERLGELASLADDAGTVIVIDHHASSKEFGDIRLVAPNAAATVVIVEELLDRLGATLDRELAACLYVGLVTDTGRFQYANTDRAAMELGSRLLETGIEHEAMSRQIFDSHSFGFLKVQARVLDRATFLPSPSLVYSWVTQDDLDTLGVAVEETESLIDVLRTVETAEVAMVLKEDTDGSWRVSLRSKGSIDVGVLATELGGGGHAFAAGFSSDASREDIVADVTARLDDTTPRAAAG
ncbi:MAG: bifunctional oligoribonuclease/PAP phosphatase NrnA [Nitriliruptorales bacterium]|nr:bifunctional oligoribonuclease/PAP phosphatase NrnA [Nitriliruptorales bacterium]